MKTIPVNMDNLPQQLSTQFNMNAEQISIFTELVGELGLEPYVYIPEPTWDELLDSL